MDLQGLKMRPRRRRNCSSNGSLNKAALGKSKDARRSQSGRRKSTSSLSAARSSVARLGSKPTDGVVVENFSWDPPCVIGYYSGSFTFSILNKLAEPITSVYGRLIFYDLKDKPVDTYEVRFAGPIQAGLAKRVRGQVDESVQRFTNREGCEASVRFRVLDFDVSSQ